MDGSEKILLWRRSSFYSIRWMSLLFMSLLVPWFMTAMAPFQLSHKVSRAFTMLWSPFTWKTYSSFSNMQWNHFSPLDWRSDDGILSQKQLTIHPGINRSWRIYLLIWLQSKPSKDHAVSQLPWSFDDIQIW